MQMRRWLAVVVLVLATGVAGCLHNEPAFVVYTIPEQEIEITIPAEWNASALESLLVGVEFNDPQLGTGMTAWVLYGQATGRSPAEQLEDLEAVLSFITDSAETITKWNQQPSSAFSVGGAAGMYVEATFRLAGAAMHCAAVAVTADGKDVMMIAQCTEALWNDLSDTFEQVFHSLRFL